ncbi:hypothetical protein KFE25_000712 [Diacronema lutheri]|uniref:Ribosomal protein/NADH dehydrogenase domain-containing protein n=1 Tax=Diacronema lutheri TaxID=2081491 RepID=A0A8J5XEN8_DIALT|nr:hypothetical protein KFE25_000712 [Diacronema lutheri]|mmetsp:Transcript_3300/g.10307  ORF Transcript_3300/g.10307 Transcript_3300/m.10307 type:complete len:89 (-) Transcript_3300:142-408(-)
MALRAVREVRVLLCKGEASAGAKQFIVDKYAEIKKAHPLLPFLVREASGAAPTLTARFAHGVEKVVPLSGLSSADVAKKLSELGSASP